MEHPSYDHEDHPDYHKNCHKLYQEMGHPVLRLTEKWKQNDQNFPVEQKPLQKKILPSEKK